MDIDIQVNYMEAPATIGEPIKLKYAFRQMERTMQMLRELIFLEIKTI